MSRPEVSVVTGAFGFTGASIARKLVDMGHQVRTLTNRNPVGHPLAGVVRTFPIDFQRPDQLTVAFDGASTLYNTYWIRFPRGTLTFDKAVENIRILVRAAEQAGVSRVVHISVSNASLNSPLPYFRGKGQAEEIIRGSQMSYAILRPTLIFGAGDILLNNIAWFLRKFPVFPIPGKGDYPVQPIHIEDVASQAGAAARDSVNLVSESAGPDILSYRDMV
ncbi:MAG: NAD(P)H-binding protein, partial [Dehalococcoidia bacterium]